VYTARTVYTGKKQRRIQNLRKILFLLKTKYSVKFFFVRLNNHKIQQCIYLFPRPKKWSNDVYWLIWNLNSLCVKNDCSLLNCHCWFLYSWNYSCLYESFTITFLCIKLVMVTKLKVLSIVSVDPLCNWGDNFT